MPLLFFSWLSFIIDLLPTATLFHALALFFFCTPLMYVHVCLYVYVARFGNIFQELLILNNSKVRWTHHKHTHTPSQADTPQARTNTCTVYLRFSAAGATLLILGRSRKTAKIWRKHLCRDTGTYIHTFICTYLCLYTQTRADHKSKKPGNSGSLQPVHCINVCTYICMCKYALPAWLIAIKVAYRCINNVDLKLSIAHLN